MPRYISDDEDQGSRPKVDDFEYWRLCDELSIVDAALLAVNCSPGEMSQQVEGWDAVYRPNGYDAVKKAITSALCLEKIKGKMVPQYSDPYSQPLNVRHQSI